MKKICAAGLLTGVLLLNSVGGVFADARVNNLSKDVTTNVKMVKISDLSKKDSLKLKNNIAKDDVLVVSLDAIDSTKTIASPLTKEEKAQFEKDVKDGKITIKTAKDNKGIIQSVEISKK